MEIKKGEQQLCVIWGGRLFLCMEVKDVRLNYEEISPYCQSSQL